MRKLAHMSDIIQGYFKSRDMRVRYMVANLRNLQSCRRAELAEGVDSHSSDR